MDKQKLKVNFESENLEVDYVSFKFQDLENSERIKLANYFYEIGFNSYQESGKLKEPIRNPMFITSKNRYQIVFVIANYRWPGTLLKFTGANAACFYSLVQKKLINWDLFSDAILGRFDLVYSRTNNPKVDKISGYVFLHNCHKKLHLSNQNAYFEKNNRGLMLKIGNRRSDQHSRIYEEMNTLRFELEMKKTFIKKYHTLLVENCLDELEHKLSSHFLIYFGKLLPLEFSYVDWLILKLRPIRKQPTLQSGFHSDYLNLEIKMNARPFVNLLQFLNYAQNLNYEIDTLGKVRYRKVRFRLRDFLKFQDPSVNDTNRYRLAKLKEFFNELQSGLYVTSFRDDYYRSLVIIPQVEFKRCPREKYLLANVWVVEDLFYYQHPFILPDFFQQKLTKNELTVRLKLIQIFTSISIEKIIDIKSFFHSYSSALNNQQKTKIKRDFIQLIKVLEKHQLIESKYKIISKGRFLDTPELTVRNISEGFVVYEKLSI